MNIYRLAPIGLILVAPAVYSADLTGTGTTYITTIDAATYGQTGTITFNDWGYVGPNGAGVNDFYVPGTTGFDNTSVGQIQNVVTYGVDSSGVSNLDGLTSDASDTVKSEDLSTTYTNASMDGQVNFYKWGFTTPDGSTFNNMQIDTAGNYFIAQEDMSFGFYDYFVYTDTTGTNPSTTVDTGINFQPYAVSDAQGWCGSVLNANPNGLAQMAGQVTFDFAFDAYFADATAVAGQGGGTQIVPDFVMRSYGDYVVNMGTALLTYSGGAVMNNTNPVTGELDPNYQNQVSFLGAGVVPLGTWVTADSYNADGTRKLNADSTWAVTVAGDGADALCDPNVVTAPRSDGAICYRNSFGGYAFLMRADGSRELYYINPEGHSDYVITDPAAYASLNPVPVPAAAWLFGSGLMGLVAVARRQRRA